MEALHVPHMPGQGNAGLLPWFGLNLRNWIFKTAQQTVSTSHGGAQHLQVKPPESTRLSIRSAGRNAPFPQANNSLTAGVLGLAPSSANPHTFLVK
jgi:hypothetical protein